MIEVCIKIDGKQYTHDEALVLYEELAAFLGKPTVKTVIERVVERERPWTVEPYVWPRPRYDGGMRWPDGTRAAPWLPEFICISK